MARMLRHRWALAVTIVFCAAIVSFSVAADFKYVGSAKSNKYHYPSCSSAHRIKPSNLVTFQSAKEALEAGYIPCKVCKPPASVTLPPFRPDTPAAENKR